MISRPYQVAHKEKQEQQAPGRHISASGAVRKSRLPALAILLFASSLAAQTIPVPQVPVDNKMEFVGSYSGDLVLIGNDFGPSAYNLSTGAVWRDILGCPRGGCTGQRFPSKSCDVSQAMSTMRTAKDAFMVDNYLAMHACTVDPNAPTSLIYRVVNGQASFAFGTDFIPFRFRGSKNGNVYWVNPSGGGFCDSASIATGATAVHVPCPASLDPAQATDPFGRKWGPSVVPPGIKVVSSVTPTRTPPIPAPTPTVFVSPSPTWTQIPGTPTPTPQSVCVTVTPRP